MRRRERRHRLMDDVCRQVSKLLEPRLSVEAAGGRSIILMLDGGAGGACYTLVAPLPRLTAKADLVATARNLAAAVHTDVLITPSFAEASRLGPRKPSVTHAEGMVEIRFFDAVDAELTPVRASLRRQ